MYRPFSFPAFFILKTGICGSFCIVVGRFALGAKGPFGYLHGNEQMRGDVPSVLYTIYRPSYLAVVRKLTTAR